MIEPNLIIVDIGRFVERHKDSNLIVELKNYLTAYDLIQVALTFDQYTGNGNAFWHLLEQKAIEIIDRIDLHTFDIGMENFTLDLDDYIRKKVPNIDTSFYIFHQWLPPTSLIIRNEKDKAIIYTDRKSYQNAAGEYVSVRDYSRDRFEF